MPVTRCPSDSAAPRSACITGYVKLLAMQIGLLLTLPGHAQETQEIAACPNTQANLDYWEDIYSTRNQDSFSSDNVDQLALQLLPCLGSVNPTLRDNYGYGLFTHWLRNDELSQDTKQILYARLINNLDSEAPLLRSFSALILSEILRADAIESFLSAEARNNLLQVSSNALVAETEYRGLDAELGWVHPVAHLSDVLWRFALHPQLTPEQARKILQTVASKATTDQTSYVFNEGDRLARVIAIIVRTEILQADEISTWLEQFTNRANGNTWGTAFNTPAGMAELHNTKSFIRALDNQLQGIDVPNSIRTELGKLMQLFAQLV